MQRLRSRGEETPMISSTQVDSCLEPLINRIFEHAIQLKDYFLAIGLALEANRPDILKLTISSTNFNYKINLLLKTLDMLSSLPLEPLIYDNMLNAFTDIVLKLDDDEKFVLLKANIFLFY